MGKYAQLKKWKTAGRKKNLYFFCLEPLHIYNKVGRVKPEAPEHYWLSFNHQYRIQVLCQLPQPAVLPYCFMLYCHIHCSENFCHIGSNSFSSLSLRSHAPLLVWRQLLNLHLTPQFYNFSFLLSMQIRVTHTAVYKWAQKHSIRICKCSYAPTR